MSTEYDGISYITYLLRIELNNQIIKLDNIRADTPFPFEELTVITNSLKDIRDHMHLCNHNDY